MKVGVIGASGYSGEVLVKLLLAHPQVELAAVTSRSQAGKPLAQVIPALKLKLLGTKHVDYLNDSERCLQKFEYCGRVISLLIHQSREVNQVLDLRFDNHQRHIHHQLTLMDKTDLTKLHLMKVIRDNQFLK
mgnify:CR=1 FL=1